MAQLIDTFAISQGHASVHFHNDATEVNYLNRWDGTLPHYGLFHRTLNYLASIGFTIGQVERVAKCISKDYRHGISTDGLEFEAERYPAGFKIEFYQNTSFENPHGGQYDFDRYDKMPYLLKKRFLLTAQKLRAFFMAMGVAETEPCDYHPEKAVEFIKHDYVKSWHHPQTDMNFELTEVDGQTFESYNSTDRDKKTLCNGEIKYFRDWSGYLCRGRIYHNINNMWWVIVDARAVRNIADFALFDLRPEDPRRRIKAHRPPESFIQRQRMLQAISTKELDRELKRRRSA